MSTFTKALESAGTDGEALAAIFEAVGGKGDPPTPEALAGWWEECPDTAKTEAAARLRTLARVAVPDAPRGLVDSLAFTLWTGWGGEAPPALWAAWPVAQRLTWAGEGDRPDRTEWIRGALPGPLAVSRRWIEADPGNRPAHPLAPIVKAWAERPTPAKAYDVTKRASLPDFGRDGAHLIDPDWIPDAFEPKDPQLALPGFEPDGGPLTHWLLSWFRATGGPIAQGGRLPLELSIAVGGIARLGIADRNGRWHTIRLPHRIEHEERFEGLDSVERWLWLDGWGKNRYGRWHLIPEALHRLRRGWAGWLAVPGLGRLAVLAPSVIPEARTDPLVELTIRIPRSAAHGARFDWPLFARYAVESAALARAYLSAVAHLHRSAHKGHPITRRIAAPVLDANGEPIRRKGGAIVRSATEVAPNPQARFVRGLADTDLARMIGHPPETASDRRKRARAREVFERLAADGVIDLERAGKTFRIFGPDGGD